MRKVRPDAAGCPDGGALQRPRLGGYVSGGGDGAGQGVQVLLTLIRHS